MSWSTRTLPSQLGPKQTIPSRKIGYFSSEFSAKNSDIPVGFFSSEFSAENFDIPVLTEALVNSFPTESTRP